MLSKVDCVKPVQVGSRVIGAQGTICATLSTPIVNHAMMKPTSVTNRAACRP